MYSSKQRWWRTSLLSILHSWLSHGALLLKLILHLSWSFKEGQRELLMLKHCPFLTSFSTSPAQVPGLGGNNKNEKQISNVNTKCFYIIPTAPNVAVTLFIGFRWHKKADGWEQHTEKVPGSIGLTGLMVPLTFILLVDLKKRIHQEVKTNHYFYAAAVQWEAAISLKVVAFQDGLVDGLFKSTCENMSASWICTFATSLPISVLVPSAKMGGGGCTVSFDSWIALILQWEFLFHVLLLRSGQMH